MDNLVLTISGEYGCEEKQIGQQLAYRLGFHFYHDDLIRQLTARYTGLSPEFLEEADRYATSSFIYSTVMNPYPNVSQPLQCDVPAAERSYFAQRQTIRTLASQKSCVVVNLCAAVSLRDMNVFRVFITGATDYRCGNIARLLGCSVKEAAAEMKREDRRREGYFARYTGEEWKNPDFYDLLVNASNAGIDGVVNTIAAMIRAKGLIE